MATYEDQDPLLQAQHALRADSTLANRVIEAIVARGASSDGGPYTQGSDPASRRARLSQGIGADAARFRGPFLDALAGKPADWPNGLVDQNEVIRLTNEFSADQGERRG